MPSEMKIIDIHTHGIDGYDTRTTTEEDILKIAEIQGSYGVSDILLAIYPSPVHGMREHMETVRKAMEIQRSSVSRHQSGSIGQDSPKTKTPAALMPNDCRPATISGLHLEGPFLNPLRCGALGAESCIEPTEDVFRELSEGYEDIIKIITIAPEMHGALRLMRKISDMGILVSMGHSDATYAESEQGFRAGAKGVTHIFNAMRGFHHREPGIAGFGLSNQDVYIEIIADPFHLHDSVIDLIFKIKNPEKIIIISDTVKETVKENQRSGVRDDRGNLLGGSMVVIKSAKRLIRQGYDEDVIMRCVTENPQAYLSRLR
jgi:N-acetylglucosamine-6-phosphate deacetylase